MLRSPRRRVLSLVLAALAVQIAAGAAPAGAVTVAVGVTDNAFVPPGLGIRPGDTVSWSYPRGAEHHNVRFEDGQFKQPAAPQFPPWGPVTRTFATAGVFPYYCEEHGGPGGQGMAGVVYVNATATVPGLPPTAAFTPARTVAAVGEVVAFDAGASSDPDGSIVRYEWDFDGDGTFEVDGGSQTVVTRAFARGGTFDVVLRVTDVQRHTATTTRRVRISQRPTASFTISPSAPQPGQAVTFDGSASSDPDGRVVRYEWDLDGDGSYETDGGASPTITHTYPVATDASIGLRVTDDAGVTGVTARRLQVTAPPPPPPPPPPPAAAAPASCAGLSGARRVSCLQRRCSALRGTRRASCVRSSCRYASRSARAGCVRSSCRYEPRSRRSSCLRSSCRYLSGAKRRACQRRYAPRRRG